MYNVKDNAESKLNFWISSIATSLIVDEWTGSLFPTPPFIAVLNKRDEDGKILKSEKIEVTDVDGDQFTVNRWFDNSEATDFNAWDYLSLFVMAKHIQELQEVLSEIQTDISEEWLVKPATENLQWTVKIATRDAINNVIVKDANWVFYVPTVSDLIPEYIGSTFISGSDIEVWNDTYVHDNPNVSECSKEFYIWKENSNKILDIQWLSNWRWFDSVTLKLSKGWLPTTKLIVEVMSAAVNGNFWTWDVLLASWELAADSISSAGLYTITLNTQVSLSLWTPFVIRLRQTDSIVNSMNYFIVYWHPTRSSDIFSWNYITVNNWVTSITNTVYDIYFSCYWKLTQAIKQNSNWRRVYDSQYIKRSSEVVASWFSYPFNLSSPDIDPNSPITISWTIQFVQHANNWATLYSWNDAQWWMRYLWVDSNRVRDISANWRTYTITLNNKSVSFSDLANWVIEIVWQASLSTRDHRWSECYFTITWNLTLNFTDLNSWWEVQAVYLRNRAKRLWLVSATLVGKHIDWSFIYPKNDGSHAVIAGQRWEDGKKIQLKVEDKCFWYKYEWEVNRSKLSEFYDFEWPEWKVWPVWPRGPMWGINYRWRLNSISDLPDSGSIEWEAYSVWWVLYIWDWEYFRNSWLAASSINVVTDWENIENKPDYVKVSDYVAEQLSQNNFDFLWRITEGLYRQLNLLDTHLWITSWENIIEVADRWIGKILVNNYFYTNYVAPSSYALTYINRNNQDYMFRFTEDLYIQINYIDPNLGIESWENMEEVADTWYGKIISDDNFYNNYIAKSSYALSFINRNNTDYLFQLSDLFYTNLNYIDSSLNFTAWDTFLEMLELPQEMEKFWSSSTMRNSYFVKSSYAINTYKNLSENVVLPIILQCLWASDSWITTLSWLMSDSTLMTSLATNSTALYAIINNTLALTALCNSSVAMNALKNSSTSMSIIAEHWDAIAKVWSITTSRVAIIENATAMDVVLKSSKASTALSQSSTTLSAIAQNLTALRIFLQKQVNIIQSLYTAMQPYSFKMYSTLKNNLTWTKYYTSDRDRTECWSKLEFRNTYYSFWETAVIFPAYYWDDSDSRSQQLRSQRFGLNVWYPHSWYGNVTTVDILSNSSDSKPMWFALKGCSAVNLWWSNNGVWVIVFIL